MKPGAVKRAEQQLSSEALSPVHPSVAVIVPTYREAENVPLLVQRLCGVRERSGLDLELVLIDDDSRDGTEEIVNSLHLPWLRLVVRTADRGLSQAVLEGLRGADRDVLVVMDADLSHPPEAIPKMLQELEEGADFVLGSRFVDGGSTDDQWGFFRWLNSRVATLLAAPLTRVKDPMSGFFALRRSTFLDGRFLNPVGYKIGLELMIKCEIQRPVEVPIHFTDRKLGESKLSFKEQLRYLQHLRRLYIHRYGTWSHLVQFLVVGLTGLAVNLLVLSTLLGVGINEKSAVAFAIALSILWNFALNRRFSFSYARREPIGRQFLAFVTTCLVGAIVNYTVTMAVWHSFRYKQVAATLGVIAGTAFNFVGSRYLVFRKRHLIVGDHDL